MAKTNKRIKWMVTVIGFAFMVGAGSVSFAGWGYGHHFRPDVDNPNYQDMMKQRDEFVQRSADFRRKLDRNRGLLQAELAAEKVDEEKVKDLQGKISFLRAEMDAFETDHMLAMKKRGSDYADFCRAGGHLGPDHDRNNGMDHSAEHAVHKGMN